jgi:hypothetical protein
VTNHDTEPASKRLKREIARDTRVVQACEACSQSHLRCEDEKPCSRCKKKKIACRVPETPVPEESDIHEIDAVHAAQDLLDLSNGYDYPSSMPAHNGNGNPSASTTETLEPFHNSPPMLMTDNTNTHRHSMDAGDPEMRTTNMGDIQPPPNTADGLVMMNQNYDHANASMPFLDNSISHFDTTPGNIPFLPDYFRSMPPFEAFMSGQATPRGIMDFSFNLDVGLTDLDLGLLDQYNFQVPFAADTPSTDAQGAEQQLSETDTAPLRAEAFKQSVWRYLPQRTRDHAAEQVNLAVPDTEKDSYRRSNFTHRRVVAEK